MKRFDHLIVLISLFSLFFYGCGGGGGSNNTSLINEDSSFVEGTIKTYNIPGSMPTNLAIDGSNNVWITNTLSNNVTKLSPTGSVVGSYPVIDGPSVIVVDNNNHIWAGSLSGLTILNNDGSLIESNTSNAYDSFAINASGDILTQNGFSILLTDINNGDVVSSLFTVNKGISSFTTDNSNNIWVCSSDNRIIKFSYSGKMLAEYKNSSFNYNFNYGNCIASDSDGNIWVLNLSSVTKLNPSGVQVANFVIPHNAYPTSIAVDGDDNLWIASKPVFTYSTIPTEKAYYDNIYKIDSNGNQIASYQQYADVTVENITIPDYINIEPYGIAVDGSGNVWVLDGNHDKISKLVGVAIPVSTP